MSHTRPWFAVLALVAILSGCATDCPDCQTAEPMTQKDAIEGLVTPGSLVAGVFGF